MKKGKDLREICFEVDISPAQELFPNFEFLSSKKNVIYLPGQNKIINFVSDSYSLIKNKKLLLPLLDLFESHHQQKFIVTEYCNIENRKFYANLYIANNVYHIQPDDYLIPVLNFTNSYDNTVPSTLKTGFLRKYNNCNLFGFTENVCDLGKHRSKTVSIDVSQIYERIHQIFFHQAKEKVSIFKDMINAKFTEDEFTYFIKEVKNHTTYPKRLLNEVSRNIKKQKIELKTDNNYWVLYNAFNYLLNHSEIKMHPEFRAKADSEVFLLINQLIENHTIQVSAA